MNGARGAGRRRDPGAERPRERSGARRTHAGSPPPGLCEGPAGAWAAAAAEGKWVTAGPSAPGTGGAGLDLRAPARAGRLPRSGGGLARAAGLLPGAPARPLPAAAARPSVAARPSSPGIRAGSRGRRPGPGRAAGAEPDAVSPVPAAAGAMGTPASVVSDPPGRAAPASRGRKRASANIFQGVGLPELRSLFRSGGAERPEERARLVWRYAGQRRMARALRRLRRRPARDGGGMAALRRFGRLR